MATKPPSKSSITVAALIVDPAQGVQFLDLGGLDVLATMSKEYFAALGLPATIIEQAPDVKIHYVTEPGPAGGPVPLTAGAKIVATDSIADMKNVDIDILFVPGPNPAYQATAAEITFIRETYARAPYTLCVCSGSLAVAASGILEGKQGTAPLPLIPALRKQYPNTEWDDRHRWIQDKGGKLWMSGGVTNGMEMTAAFMREVFWDRKELVELAVGAVNVGDKEWLYTEKELKMVEAMRF